MKDETPFRYTHAEIRSQVVVICDPTRYQLDYGLKGDLVVKICLEYFQNIKPLIKLFTSNTKDSLVSFRYTPPWIVNVFNDVMVSRFMYWGGEGSKSTCWLTHAKLERLSRLWPLNKVPNQGSGLTLPISSYPTHELCLINKCLSFPGHSMSSSGQTISLVD